MLRHLLNTALVLFALSPAFSQDEPSARPGAAAAKAPSLKLGDKAPALAVEKWVKGEPVKAFEKGKVYVVEFWATWCPPCIASMPHLTELQKKYKDKGVRMIGVTSEDPRNSLDAVEAMVKKQGDEKMGYTVAWDKGTATYDAYMEASGQDGIPCAFVVNGDGIVAYIGHPMGMDKPLEAIVAGKYDIAKAREKEKLMAKLMPELQAAFQKKDWEGAVKGIDAILKEVEDENELYEQKFFILLLLLKQYDKAYAFGKELLGKQLKDDSERLNKFAWTILDKGDLEKRDVDLALAMAQRASELTQDKDPQILDTLALAHYKKGDAKKALELQEKAIGLAPGEMKKNLEGRLKIYKDGAGGKTEEEPKGDK